MSLRFFRSNRPGFPHPVSSELENSGIRVAVGDCSVTEPRRWRLPYQTSKAVHVHTKHYKHNMDGCTVPGVCGNGCVPLSHSGNIISRTGIHTHTNEYSLRRSNQTTFTWSKFFSFRADSILEGLNHPMKHTGSKIIFVQTGGKTRKCTYIQSNFSGSTTFGTMKISPRQG